MEKLYGRAWVEGQVEQAIVQWQACAMPSLPSLARFTPANQLAHEQAYDEGLRAVEHEASQLPSTRDERLRLQQRIVAQFSRFASIALGLEAGQSDLITAQFMPAGIELARWARVFDSALSPADIIQACRNAWTCCGLQALLGQPMSLTPSILAYSLLYPYSDNYLDRPGLSNRDKLRFSERFHRRLRGLSGKPANRRESAIWTMVQMIERQYPRQHFPQVFDCLLAIHRAQEQSVAQLPSAAPSHGRRKLPRVDHAQLLRISCAKGGASVLADACLAKPLLDSEEIRLAFEWGVLLQLGDDLQDVHEDLRRGSTTLFTRAVMAGEPLDSLIAQLLHFSGQIADRMEQMPSGSPSLKSLLRMSWCSLILMAVADVHAHCTPQFLAALEPCSSFRFSFLRARNRKLTGRRGLYENIFAAFVEDSNLSPAEIFPASNPLPSPRMLSAVEI